ncbi:MAG: hypothetical protein IKG37_03700, partial [Solobacterium sp.]|nr:hypothetical protein [Solobacterium sp.]
TLYGGYYSDYAGKSEGYDSAALDYSDDSKDFDTDGKAYSYEYIQESNKAAWKYADGYDTIGTAMEPAAFETYYLKEVPTGYLRPYTHFTYYKSNKKIGSMWSILDLDDLNYQKAWFTVQTDNKPAIVCEAMNVKASNGTSTVTLTAGKVFKSKGVLDGYLGYAEVNSYLGKTTVVRQYWQTKDGIEVHGTHERTMTYSNGLVYTGLKSTDTEIED